MALGTLGSTLNDELNRLANGGTYRDMNQMVDEALAAKQWANRENINPYSTDTVGILNEIAGLGLDKKNWLDFNGVCNYIAGTTGLPAAAALRQVYPTTDLLTGVASYYVDATTPQNWGSLGYVYLDGVAGNYLSVPDASNLDITGDIDLRAYVALDDWTPAAASATLISKYITTGNQRSYRLQVATNGTLQLTWSAAGTAASGTVGSTVAPTIADGSPLWVRATLDVDNGASGNTATFYTSTDGSSWTQLGSPVVTAGVTSIYAGTAILEIGASEAGSLLAGKLYRAQVLNGIGGTTVLDVNIATDYSSSRLDTFTATTGQTVTVNGVGVVNNLGTAGSLLPTTVGSSTAADSNDPKFLDHTGTNYVYLPGVASNYLSVPDAAALDITGDIDIRVQVAMDDWTPGAARILLSKWNFSSQNSYRFFINSANGLQLDYSTTGSDSNSRLSTVANTITDGTVKWVRTTRVASTGLTKFFTSDDGNTWTQLGADVSGASGNMFVSTTEIQIGATVATSANAAGKIFRAQIFNGIDGTKVLDVDTSVITAGSATSFTAVTGQTVTINRSTSGRKTVAVTQPVWLFGTDDYMEVNNRWIDGTAKNLYLPGIAASANNATSPDSAALDITGDIDIRAKIAMDSWTDAGFPSFINKNGTATTQRSYGLGINSGTVYLAWSPDGTSTNEIRKDATTTVGLSAGTTKWIRATLDVDNGASGNTVTFYTSDDGTSWTQLGNTVTTAGTTSIFSGTGTITIGGNLSTSNQFRGRFYRAQVYNGIGGTLAFDANFETSITSVSQTTFTESSANAATVTINRSGSTYRSAGITTSGYLYPGATNTFTASATDFLNFEANQSFTVMAILRDFGTDANGRTYIMKKFGESGAATAGYYLWRYAGNTYGQISDATTYPGNADKNNADVRGTMAVNYLARNVISDTFYVSQNALSPVSKTDTTTTTLANIYPFRIGTSSQSIASAGDFELAAAAVFRSVLTASQIRQISNYFANREVYL
jgi:hypothetical protein